MSAGTKQSWTVGRFAEGDYSVQLGDGGDTIAEKIPTEEMATLMASAPELLEALEDLIYGKTGYDLRKRNAEKLCNSLRRQ